MIRLLCLVACASEPPVTPPEEPPPSPAPVEVERERRLQTADRYVWTVRALTEAEQAAMVGVSWQEGCPVPLDDLRRLDLSHWTAPESQRVGVLVVHKDVTAAVASAFGAAWEARFIIERMEPIEVYGGDDVVSMRANNTSAFNCRRTDGTDAWSKHSYGIAIDVNPLWNPWVRTNPDGSVKVAPEEGRAWVDRANVRPGMLTGEDPLVKAFLGLGWGWGGTWSRSKDYQHLSADGK